MLHGFAVGEKSKLDDESPFVILRVGLMVANYLPTGAATEYDWIQFMIGLIKFGLLTLEGSAQYKNEDYYLMARLFLSGLDRHYMTAISNWLRGRGGFPHMVNSLDSNAPQSERLQTDSQDRFRDG